MSDALPLEELTHERFAPLEGERFELRWQEGSTPATLVEVSARDDLARPEGRTPFSLVFEAPSEPALGQGNFEVSHATLGTAVLFLVPIFEDERGRRYEACFT